MCATINAAAVLTITAIRCNRGRLVWRKPAERAMPTAPTVTSAWIHDVDHADEAADQKLKRQCLLMLD